MEFMFHMNRMWTSYGSHLLETWNYTLSANINDDNSNNDNDDDETKQSETMEQ